MVTQHGSQVVDFQKLLYQYLVLREGYKLVVYKDTKGFLTVGIGHKVTAADGLKLGQKITDQQCYSFFQSDYDRLKISSYISDKPGWEGNQRLAVASFIWSHGDAQYKDSQLRMKLTSGASEKDTLAYLKASWDVHSPVNQARNLKDISLFYSSKAFPYKHMPEDSFFQGATLARAGLWLQALLFSPSSH